MNRSRGFRVRRGVMDGVEAVAADTAFSFGRHMHDQFGIGVIVRGAQASLSGRGVVEAGAGDIITVNPGEVHDGAPIGGGGRCWTMLYLDPALVSAIVTDLTDGRLRDAELTQPVVRDTVASACFHRLFAAMVPVTPPDVSGMAVQEGLIRLLGRLMGRDVGAVPQHPVPHAIAQARARIDDEPDAALSLDDLAVPCGLSRYQLLRGFAKATGLTPHAYMIQRRLQRARRLIAQGTGLAEAAAFSGFADQSHMTRLFIRTYGLSPGCYAAAVR